MIPGSLKENEALKVNGEEKVFVLGTPLVIIERGFFLGPQKANNPIAENAVSAAAGLAATASAQVGISSST